MTKPKTVTRGVFGAGHEKADLIRPPIAQTTACGDDLRHVGMVVGKDRGDYDQVAGMLALEGIPVLCPGLAGREFPAMDRLPDGRPAVADRLVRTFALIGRE